MDAGNALPPGSTSGGVYLRHCVVLFGWDRLGRCYLDHRYGGDEWFSGRTHVAHFGAEWPLDLLWSNAGS